MSYSNLVASNSSCTCTRSSYPGNQLQRQSARTVLSFLAHALTHSHLELTICSSQCHNNAQKERWRIRLHKLLFKRAIVRTSGDQFDHFYNRRVVRRESSSINGGPIGGHNLALCCRALQLTAGDQRNMYRRHAQHKLLGPRALLNSSLHLRPGLGGRAVRRSDAASPISRSRSGLRRQR